MARSRDETKRQTILNESKRLFAERGFADTAISDIVRETGLPVGTIYTYFQSKDEIIESIVEEGWAQFYGALRRLVDSALEPLVKLRRLITEFLPLMLQDVELMNILVTEAVTHTGMDRKIDAITDSVMGVLAAIPSSARQMKGLSRAYLRSAVMIYSLGMMHAARFARDSTAGMSMEEIVSFTRTSLSHWMEVEV